MKRNLKKSLLPALLLGISMCAGAQQAPSALWLRHAAISPDSKTIALSFGGDIYTVSATGGLARQITSNAAFDSTPMWTRDSKSIVFSSYREGSKDIFITSAEGGRPVRVTDIPGSETPLAVLEDGTILFSASLGYSPSWGGFPGSPKLYSIKPGEGRETLVSSLTISDLCVNADGEVLYEDYKGYEDPLRKHHTSSVTRDIWLYRGQGGASFVKMEPSGSFTKLTSNPGEDRNPLFAPDGKSYYFLSERDSKTFNVYKASIDSPDSAPLQLTSHTKNPVRYLSVSDDGLLCYSYNGELYTLREGAAPVKLSITILSDNEQKASSKISVTSGATSMSPSKNGEEIAIVVRGDVFVTSEEFRTTRRITDTPEQERGVSFAPDGKSLYYASERGGNWSIYRTVLTDKKDKCFTYNTKMKEELFSPAGQTCQQPQVSPDGKYVAYLRDRTELVVQETKGGAPKSLLKGLTYSYSDGDLEFSWSPDSRFLLSTYQGEGGWNNADVALVEVSTGKVTNLTESGYSDSSFRWALGGKAMTFESDKNGYRSHGSWGAEGDVYLMFFDTKALSEWRRGKEGDHIEKMTSELSEKKQEKKDKKDSLEKAEPKKLELFLEGREDRIFRLTPSSARLGDHYLSPDGRKLYYITPLEKGRGLCELDLREGSVKVLRRDVGGRIIPSSDGKDIYLFTGNSISKISLAGGQPKNISFSGDFDYRPAAERQYIFSHIWKQVQEKFYDPDIHGIDWQYYHDNYAQFLPYINNNFDFQEMLSEMLGELNGSHTGARYRPISGVSPSYLGVVLDPDYSGDGLRIAEVLPGGPIYLADPGIKPGDVIQSIEGTKILAGQNWYPLLQGRSGKRTSVEVSTGGKTKEYLLTPISSESTLLYRRWVRQREKIVEELSGGKVGYVHVQGMNSPSFREVYSKALGKYRSAEALIVDTRHNGGGWLHDDLATFLSGKAYIDFKPRGQYIGTEPYNKWNKPSCVLVCEDNYSDASGFPYTYKTLGIGPVVGTCVPGTMTAVWWETLLDPTLVFGIPEVGSFALKEGRYLENLDLEPDILVFNTPEGELSGKDEQLEAAVREMLRAIESKK